MQWKLSIHTPQCRLRPKLHYTDTGYGHVVQHHQRTPPKDELATILQQICHIAMPQPNISTCPADIGMWQIFVRWWWICCTTSCRIVVSSSVGGVRSRCPCSGVWHLAHRWWMWEQNNLFYHTRQWRQHQTNAQIRGLAIATNTQLVSEFALKPRKLLGLL